MAFYPQLSPVCMPIYFLIPIMDQGRVYLWADFFFFFFWDWVSSSVVYHFTPLSVLLELLSPALGHSGRDGHKENVQDARCLFWWELQWYSTCNDAVWTRSTFQLQQDRATWRCHDLITQYIRSTSSACRAYNFDVKLNSPNPLQFAFSTLSGLVSVWGLRMAEKR